MIGVGFCYYNDIESIKRSIPTFVNEVDYVFAIDGRFSLRDGEDYSTDGSTEYLSGFSNVIIRKYVGMEHDKRQQYVEMAKEYNCSILLIIDTDEYVVDANWPLFRENIKKIENSTQNIHGVNFYYTDKDVTPYPRLWLRPHEIKYHKAHCIFNVNGNFVRSPSGLKSVEGISFKMDDSLRSEEYLKKTSEYQGRMIEYEKPIRHAVANNEMDKLLH